MAKGKNNGLQTNEEKNVEYFTIWGKNLGDFSFHAQMMMPAEWDDMQIYVDRFYM